ncbi:16597_t:CDS:2, partial [Acaulospora colombiana]
ADQQKAGADIGKIVNMMSTDAGRISNTASALTMLYGAPLELIIGAIFLYQLLGISGFAGFTVLILGSPLNGYLMTRGRDINKATMEARDKRMKVLTELISEAKFIKFGASEDSEQTSNPLISSRHRFNMLLQNGFRNVWMPEPKNLNS